ncbi:hypothetical protein ABZ070_36155 [Streptomyces sp. NPDC006283]|uniref:hypothetical protein n=1 Tax=Streptomyces sp. NPDC006283 TaxID=3156741 RepID=UPI0033A0739F
MYAWRQSHFPEAFVEREGMGDLGYLAPACSPRDANHLARNVPTADKVCNQSISKLRAAVERAIAHLKGWKILATATAPPSETSPSSPRPSPLSPLAGEAP